MNWRRPQEREMAGYFVRYADQVMESNPVHVLKDLKNSSLALMSKLDESQWNHAYAPGKWSVKEVWLHIIDTERIFTYRALRIGRGDKTPLPGFNQDDYILPSKANERSVSSIMKEYETVRNATISLFENLPMEALDMIGTASDNPISCRAFAFIIPGHERHHLKGLADNYGILGRV